MRSVVLPGTELRTSRLGFGTASLHHVTSSRRRQDLLAAAADHGFTHFDTSPYYGFGIAEEELGRFASTRRGRFSIATKIGLYAPAGATASAASVWARKVMGVVIPRLKAVSVDWSVETAAKSLERSLARLAVERIDVLLLHEPAPGQIDQDAFLDWLERERRRGRIGCWGLAGEVTRMGTLLPASGLARVVQVRDSLEGREADAVTASGRALQLTYGYLSAHGRNKQTDARSVLKMALRRNTTGCVLVSSRDRRRIAELAAAAEHDEPIVQRTDPADGIVR